MEISGASGDIASYLRIDGKPLSDKGKISELGGNLRDFRLYSNPLEGLFGYHAKHNRESSIGNEGIKESKNEVKPAEYTTIKIFGL